MHTASKITATEPTHLVSSYDDKDAVKALGARWSGVERIWFVPAGIDLTPFAQWIPGFSAASPEPVMPTLIDVFGDKDVARSSSASQGAIEFIDTDEAVSEAEKGVSLSSVLRGVASAVSAAYRTGVWVRAEVISINARSGHMYIELAERDASGNTIASSKGFVPAGRAAKIFPAFEAATGARLAAGIKVLVLAKPVFNVRYGLSLEIEAIDHAFTMGDLEAKKREIRARLTAEGIFDANKLLPKPEDFTLVLVVAPADAAGLGDFRADSDLLHSHGVCTFEFAHSRFQGEGAAAEIVAAASKGLRDIMAVYDRLPDAVCVIRGGGAVNDMAWLNDYALAKWVATCPVPVFTGIGHERDNVVLDEIANTRFDTPSKVVAGIRDVIVTRVQAVKEFFGTIMLTAERAAGDSRIRSKGSFEAVKAAATGAVNQARLNSERLHAAVRTSAASQVSDARQKAPLLMSQVKAGAEKALADAKSKATSLMSATAERGRAVAQIARQNSMMHMGVVNDRSLLLVENAKKASKGLFREIMGQGPQKTLERGFGIVRNQEGQAVTRASGMEAGKSYEIEFADGKVSTLAA